MQPTIVTLSNSQPVIAELADLLVETVAAGGSVNFLHPLSKQMAEAFWRNALSAADRGERIVLGARAAGMLVSTASVRLDSPPNAQHRAEVTKVMTRVAFRNRGIARALMLEVERAAAARGRTLLTLDTARDDGAAGFYERLGYELAGVIPDYASKPHGGLTDAIFYWKRIGPLADLAVAD